MYLKISLYIILRMNIFGKTVKKQYVSTSNKSFMRRLRKSFEGTDDVTKDTLNFLENNDLIFNNATKRFNKRSKFLTMNGKLRNFATKQNMAEINGRIDFVNIGQNNTIEFPETLHYSIFGDDAAGSDYVDTVIKGFFRDNFSWMWGPVQIHMFYKSDGDLYSESTSTGNLNMYSLKKMWKDLRRFFFTESDGPSYFVKFPYVKLVLTLNKSSNILPMVSAIVFLIPLKNGLLKNFKKARRKQRKNVTKHF